VTFASAKMFSRVNIIFPKKHSSNLLFNLLTRWHHVKSKHVQRTMKRKMNI